MRCILITGSSIIAYYLLDDPPTVKMILYKVYLFSDNCSVSSCACMRVNWTEQCGLIDSSSQLVRLVTLAA